MFSYQVIWIELIQSPFIPVPMCLKINEIYNAQGLFGVFRVIEVNGSQVPLSANSNTKVP